MIASNVFAFLGLVAMIVVAAPIGMPTPSPPSDPFDDHGYYPGIGVLQTFGIVSDGMHSFEHLYSNADYNGLPDDDYAYPELQLPWDDDDDANPNPKAKRQMAYAEDMIRTATLTRWCQASKTISNSKDMAELCRQYMQEVSAEQK